MEEQLITIYNNERRVGTKTIADGFNRKHDNIKRLVQKYQKEFEKITFLKQSITKGKTKNFEEYFLTYDQLLFLISVIRNGEGVIDLKAQMIKAKNISSAIDLIKAFDFDTLPVRYVYAVVDNQNRIKIGISNNPKERVKNLNVGNADELTLIFTKKADKRGYTNEIEFHKKCEPFLIRSEWFSSKAMGELK